MAPAIDGQMSYEAGWMDVFFVFHNFKIILFSFIYLAYR